MNALFRFLNSNFGVLISGAVISGLIVQYIEHKSLETTTKTALARATAAPAEHVSTQPPLEVHNPAQLRDLAASAARIFGWDKKEGPQTREGSAPIKRAKTGCSAARASDQEIWACARCQFALESCSIEPPPICSDYDRFSNRKQLAIAMPN
jgi:hypothetical protein